MLDRRGFFLTAVGAVASTQLDGPALAVQIEANAHYILFYDAQAIDGQELAMREMPGLPSNCMIELVPVKVRYDHAIDDAVRLYKVE